MINIEEFELSFIAVGPQRTGTTWLHRILEGHPSIGLPSGIKETMFFDKYYDKGNAWLFTHYKNHGNDRVLGEIAPTYFGSETALKRIKLAYPDCKILINIRNPVDHAYSMYLHETSKGRIHENLKDIIRHNPEKIRAGMYADWIPRWQEEFGEEKVCLVWMDQIKTNPKNSYGLICKFLGITSTHYPQDTGHRQVNASKKPRYPTLTRYGVAVYHLLREYRLHSVINFCKRLHLDKITFGMNKNQQISKLTSDEFKALVDLYDKDIKYLELISGQDLSSWRSNDS